MPRYGSIRIVATIAFVVFSFCLHAQFVLNNSAMQIDENCYRLTPAADYVKGSIWYVETVDLTEDFEVITQMFLGCNDAGADGIAFALQPLGSDIGGVGGGLGIEGVEPSLIIEFDTYQNTDRNDPDFDHAAILRDGVLNHGAATNLAGPVSIAPGGQNVEDCAYHHLRITWNAAEERLSYYWDCQLRLSWAGDVIDDIFGGDPQVYWGFSSATGAANNEHKMCFNHISFIDTADHEEICLGEEVDLHAPDGTTFLWTPSTGLSDPNVQNPTASPEVTTNYTVQISDECELSYDYEVLVEVHQPLTFSLGDDIAVCEGETVELDPGLPSNGTFEWQDGSGAPAFTVTQEGIYTLTYTETGGCPYTDDILVEFHEQYEETVTEVICEGEAMQFAGEYYDETGFYTNYNQTTHGCDSITNLNLAVVSNPMFTIDGPGVICVSDPDAQLSVPVEPEYSSYFWNTGETTPSILIESGGLYSVTVTSVNGCTGEHLVYVNESGTTADTLFQQICEGDSVLFNGSQFHQSGVYADTLSTDDGCDSIVLLDLTVQGTLQPAITGDSAICNSATGSLHTATNFDSYNWSTGDSTPSIDIQSEGLYTVTVSSGSGCSGTDSVYVSGLPPSADSIERQICSGQSLMFGGDTLGEAGWYSDSLTGIMGCDSIVTLHLTVGDFLDFSISGESVICPSATLQLQAPGDYQSYRWSTGDSSDIIEVNNAGLYAVTVTDSTGCSGMDSILISEIELVRDSIQAAICEGGSYIFGDDTLSQAGLYTDTLASSAACDSVVLLWLTASGNIDVDISGNTDICPASVAVLQAPAGLAAYLWSTGENTEVITPGQEGWYALTVTDSSGCHGHDSVYVSVRPAITDTSVQKICEGDSYIWNSQSLVNEGLYADTFASVEGCDSIAVLQLELLANPAASIRGDSILCPGGTGLIEAAPPGLSYEWNGGHTGSSLQISAEGWYGLTVTDQSGCSGADSIYVSGLAQIRDSVPGEICQGESYQFGGLIYEQAGTYMDTFSTDEGCDSISVLLLTVHALPEVVVLGDSTVCENETAGLQADGGFQSYIWSTGESTPGISVDAAGLYSLTVTDDAGCSAEASTEVEHINFQLKINTEDPLCPGEENGSITVTEAEGGLPPYDIMIAGQPAELGQPVEGLREGEYGIVLSDLSGCIFDTTVLLSEPPVWTLDLGDDREVDYGETVVITAATSLDSIAGFDWTSADTAFSITPTELGLRPMIDQWVGLQLVDGNGCTRSDSIFLHVTADFRVYFPNAFSPNDDGINDQWRPYWPDEAMEELHFTVFNRWGDKVFDCNGLDCRWDGRFNGQKLDPGVFAFLAKYRVVGGSGEVLIYGEITLVE